MKTITEKQLAEKITKLVTEKGTAIVGFVYGGKARNMVLGADLSKLGYDDGKSTVRYINAGLTENFAGTRKYLRGRLMNDENPVKRFALDKIEQVTYDKETFTVV